MVNFEQVQKLRDRANISYEEAKKALEETNGDLLQAMINLEKQNKIKAPEAGGYYNSQGEQQGGKGDGRGH
ncbi:MAG TPA: ubiquitin, partial [Firmicutes bacterium]|nr:ubiquitin [Bacillota bacterium]